jgi:hypothetical protein
MDSIDLTDYMEKLDKQISVLDNANKNEKYRQIRTIQKCDKLLKKETLTEEDIAYLKHTISYSYGNIFDRIPNVFYNIVSKLFNEYRQTKEIPVGLLELLEDIVSKEDFFIFSSDNNLIGLEMLSSFNECISDNTSLEAIVNYLTNYDTLMSKISEIKEPKKLEKTKERIDCFHHFLLGQETIFNDLKEAMKHMSEEVQKQIS